MKAGNKPLSHRQDRLVQLLPEHNWNITKAGLAAGYKKSYVEGQLPNVVCANVCLKAAIEAKKQAFAEQSRITIEELEKRYDTMYRLCKDKDRRCALSALDSLTRMRGGFYDRSEHTVKAAGPALSPKEERARLLDRLKLLEAAEDAGTALATE